jgi:hypothetical protein
MNSFQKTLTKVYGGGDFAHVTTDAEAEEAGDTLFLSLWRELSAREGCGSNTEARYRVAWAIEDLEGVLSALEGEKE